MHIVEVSGREAEEVLYLMRIQFTIVLLAQEWEYLNFWWLFLAVWVILSLSVLSQWELKIRIFQF